MTKLSHLPWYWQEEWGLKACTCGLLALVWKLVCFGGKKCILLFKSDSFFVSIYDMTSIFVSLSCQEGNVLTCIFNMGLFVKLSQDKQWWITSIQMCCLYMCLLHSKWEERESQPKQTENTQSMTICNIYAKSFTQQRHIPRLLAAPIIQIRNT